MEQQLVSLLSSSLTSTGLCADGAGCGAGIAGTFAEQTAGYGSAMAGSVAASPLVGIALLSVTGAVLCINASALQTLRGPGTRAEDVIGGALFAGFPKEWNEGLSGAIEAVVRSEHPQLVRTLWNGVQIMTWLQALAAPRGATEAGVVLAVSHRVAGDPREWLEPTCDGYIESGVLRLGPLNKLTAPELRVLALLGQGYSVREVSKQLFRAEKTIEFHRTTIHRKLKITDRVELARIAQRAGLTLADADRPRM